MELKNPSAAEIRRQLEQDDGHAESWIAKPGDSLVGELLKYSTAFTSRGDEAVIATILDDETGQLKRVWLLHKVLLDAFAQARPKPGTLVGLRYLGKHETKGYHRWACRFGGGAAAMPDFRKFVGSDAGDAPNEGAAPDWAMAGGDDEGF